jgi:hypothetical protein
LAVGGLYGKAETIYTLGIQPRDLGLRDILPVDRGFYLFDAEIVV